MIQIRGKPIFLSLLETFPDEREVTESRCVDEIHVQLLQSQLEGSQSINRHPILRKDRAPFSSLL